MRMITVIGLLLAGMFHIQGCKSGGGESSSFQFPKQVRILKAEHVHSTCYDYAVSELIRLLGRIHISAHVSEEEYAKGAFCLRIIAPETSPQQIAPDDSQLFADGYLLDISESHITLVARQPKGILNGVYDLAGRLGYLFLFPGIRGEWEPVETDGGFALPAGREIINPRFRHRGIFNGSSEKIWVEYYAKLRFNLCNPLDPQLAEKLGLRIEVGGHDLDQLLPPTLFSEYPQMYRMAQPEDFFGQRINDYNFCVTHPKARQLIQENYREKLKPLLEKGVYAWHTWQEDLPAGGWCYCPTCRSFTAADQAMLSMRMLADVIREDKLPMRVPMLAYHDTMFPGKKIDAPKEAFLLFAPRERCYAHALDDPSCPNNRVHKQALGQWAAKFNGIDDAHTFEYYFDRVLFRGLYPFLPEVILNDMRVYEAFGIETYTALQVGTVFVPELAMRNFPVFAEGMWNKNLNAELFIRQLARKIQPNQPSIWETYFTKYAGVYSRVMRWCENDIASWADYRWLPETTTDFGREMARLYRENASELNQIADDLADAITPDMPERVKSFARHEVARLRFEAAELEVMHVQQKAANAIGAYLNSGDREKLEQGIACMRETLAQLENSQARAEQTGIKAGDYYYMYNEWITKELKAKIRKFEPDAGP
ncbi:DUF4838 domain-containing protein [candidate division KSB1 bacterium]|nr:DUF4838 domain-containing protein [candidate division KSB1 bacterium]